MQEQDKIFGLIAQAEDIQKHAVTIQGAVQDALKTLPGTARDAIREAAREILIQEAQKASEGLLDASRGAIVAAEEIRNAQAGALLKHSLILCLVAVMISAAIYFGLGFLAKQRAAELAELADRARTMRATVDKLNSEYGKAMFSTCKGRPCVRVDERAGRYGEPQKGELYMVIFNY